MLKPTGDLGGLTPGDDTGARAEWLRDLRFSHPAREDDCPICFLLAELDRVTAERETLQIYYENANAARSDAVSSRNAWAERAAEADREWERACVRTKDALAQVKQLRDALMACHSFLADPEGFAGVTISDTVWTRPGETLKDWAEGALAATDPIETIENPIDATEPKP